MQNMEQPNVHSKFPYHIRPSVNFNKIKAEFYGQSDGAVEVGEEKWLLPSSYADFAETIYNFEARTDDVFICTYPRSGTTWTQEMAWLICNDLDYETASNVSTFKRVPFLEFHVMANALLKRDPVMTTTFMKSEKIPAALKTNTDKFGAPYERLKAVTGQRIIKTHFPFSLMPRNIRKVGAKVIYVARNPKDVAVSFYHFHKAYPFYQFTGNFETFLEYFMDDLILRGPYWKHILDGWSHRNDENVHFMFYENIKFDMENSVRKLATFLGKPLTDEDLTKLVDHLAFDNMKKNKKTNLEFNHTNSANFTFLRRGEVGGNPEITKQISMKIDDWTRKNLEKTDIKLHFKL